VIHHAGAAALAIRALAIAMIEPALDATPMALVSAPQRTPPRVRSACAAAVQRIAIARLADPEQLAAQAAR
jgi:hypothetical protein